MLLKLLLALVFFTHVTNGAWLSPFFKEGPRTDVNIFIGNPMFLAMDEEIPVEDPIIVAIVAGYDGVAKPQIGSFQMGNNLDLGLDFVRNTDDEWEMIVRNRQDFEQVNMQKYILAVQIDGQQVTVQITINNIFDNAPVISYESNSCSIKELQEPGYDSLCVYNVFDADGINGNEIKFEIRENLAANQRFEFRQRNRIDDYNIAYTLIVKETLYYDQVALYNFKTWVGDIKDNFAIFNIIIEIEDLPNKEPMWVKAFASARFFEKTAQNFEVIAIDGDTGINTRICYKLGFEEGKDYSEFITIVTLEASGKIDVEPIDRDAQKNEFYPFEIFAYKCNDDTSFISGSAAFIVDDINDNFPEITFPEEKQVIQIKEESFATLFTALELVVNDIDLGIHATYDIILTQKETSRDEYSKAFNIVPLNGYQEQGFTISVANTALIDFEEELWQEFDIIIKATEVDLKEHEISKSFKVQLLNWNDELPMFSKDEYTFQVLETISKDSSIGIVTATDRDIDDEIIHFITGRISESISISPEIGELKTLVDNAFDYERQTEVFIQVQARDTLQTMGEPTHTTFTQVRIEVIDVNDEAPTLKMPRQVLSILENTREKIITNEIEAFDPDTTAKLKFTIDWEESWADKPGTVVDRKFFEGCFIIEELEETNNKVYGILSVNSAFEYNIDYEEFEVVYLTIVVEDIDQEIMPNKASAILVVRIEDENDNAPEFVGDTLTVSRRVIEEAEEGTLIGNVLARDIDGPMYNIIQYSIVPAENTNTPDGWVSIDSSTGVLEVSANREIGCDVPKRDDLKYTVKLFDGKFEVTGIISIAIMDINNKVPKVDEFESEISVYESL